MADAGKKVMLVAVDDSSHSFYALEWALDHFFTPFAPNFPFKLIVVHVRPTPTSVLGLAGPATGDVMALVETDLKKMSQKTIDKTNEICKSKSVSNAKVEVMEGDPRNVLIEAADKLHASMLILGSHGYGAIKRAVLGSVSDYCAHHCQCSVMIVKKPKAKN